MEKLVNLCALLCLAMSFGCSDNGAVSETDSGVTDTSTDTGWDSRFDAFASALEVDLESNDAYGISAAVMENGAVTFARAFGSKDSEGNAPLTPDTLMQIGSTTKSMTTVAFLKKVESGQIDLDDTLNDALPGFEFEKNDLWDDQIAMHHLLSHQSGIYDFISWDGSNGDSDLEDLTYGYFAEQVFLMNPPGIFWNYSNPNFSLIGLVTQTLDNRMWPDIVEEDVYLPLGMDRTYLRKSEVEADGDFAISYGIGLDDLTTGAMGPVEMEDMPDPAWVRPAGLAWTTPTQMMTWAKFLMGGDSSILSDELRAKMFEKQIDTLYDAGNEFYGYAMFVRNGYLTSDDTWYETPVYEHGGASASFTHAFYMFPDLGFAFAICISGQFADLSHSTDVVVTTIADLPEPSQPWEYQVDPEEFDKHVGEYIDQYNIGDVIVTKQGNSLQVEAPTLEQYGYTVSPTLTPVSSDIFLMYINGDAYDMTFIPKPGEQQSSYMRNRLFVATRVEALSSGTSRHAPSRANVRKFVDSATMANATYFVRKYTGLNHGSR